MVIPGSHKSNLPHPALTDYASPMDTVAGAIEVNLKKGDALLFADGLSHGASSRTNPGERRATIYRYGVSWGSTRYGYGYSEEFLPTDPGAAGDFAADCPTTPAAGLNMKVSLPAAPRFFVRRNAVRPWLASPAAVCLG